MDTHREPALSWHPLSMCNGPQLDELSSSSAWLIKLRFVGLNGLQILQNRWPHSLSQTSKGCLVLDAHAHTRSGDLLRWGVAVPGVV